MSARSALFLHLPDTLWLSQRDDLINALVAEVEVAVRASIAADFMQFGQHKDVLSWGEAVLIAREGLCNCRGGSKPCETAATS